MLDIFNDDAFSLTSLTATINEMDYKPGRLGQLGLFQESGVNTTTVVVESINGELRLLPSTERGAPATQAIGDKRQLRSFVVPHIPHDSTILAAEVQNVRQFGSEDAMQGVQAVVNQRLQKMNANHEVTLEFLRMGALKGEILDGDGSTILYNLFDEFGVTQQTHDFKFSSTTTDVRAQGVKARRLVDDALGALPYSGLHAFCGSDFFDGLVGHKSVKEAYQRWQDGEALRTDPKGRFRFADIDWEEYRGSVGGNDFVAANEAYLYPTGADIFRTWFAPADFVETVNTIGLPRYAKQKVMDFEKGVIVHTQSNPLPINLRPRAVIKLTMS
ncbi:major capsid protein [Endozoicomonas sp. GU-1]|uniref:major capsid protein n=1 Tax=Endozoicomonas sp. GU-1 TaxID=3009078 RepID=UPI0022B2BA42|nr:major capsid protein [Endozoicomonas sp. GU-1]WBA83731.1 major capsid protein [Endozoicomonas sp. GU-1]